MSKIFKNKKIMITIMCVIILLMIGLATFSIVRNKKVKHTDTSSWILNINYYDSDGNDISYQYPRQVPIAKTKTILKCGTKEIVSENDIKYIKKKNIGKTSIVKEQKIPLDLRYYLVDNFKSWQFEFDEYPHNNKKNVLIIYYELYS